jgi:hypothetical protein
MIAHIGAFLPQQINHIQRRRLAHVVNVLIA